MRQKLNAKLQKITNLEGKIKKNAVQTSGLPTLFETVLDKKPTSDLTDAATLQRSASAN